MFRFHEIASAPAKALAIGLAFAGACVWGDIPPAAPGAGLTLQPRAKQAGRNDGYVSNTVLVQMQVYTTIVGACSATPLRPLDFGYATDDGYLAPVRPEDVGNQAVVKVNGPPFQAYQLFSDAEAEARRVLRNSERPEGSTEIFGSQSIRIRVRTDRSQVSGVHGSDGAARFSLGGEALQQGRDAGRYIGTMNVLVGYQ